jgi:MinD-like ATPase involved in chromosome partitioning or flagellar assembly
VEDENADRVYVPGTNPTPPARDVEPIWPPEELEAPVHGGKPVPHEAPPGTPVPSPSIPAPPNAPAPPSVPVNGAAGPVPPPAPVSGGDEQVARAAPDSPWAQPPNRPAPAPQGADEYDGVDIQELGSRNRGQQRDPGPGPAQPTYYPTVAPRPGPENPDQPNTGTVYRPGVAGPAPAQGRVSPDQRRPTGPAQPGPTPPPAAPSPQNRPAQPQTGPVRPQTGPAQPGPAQPGPGPAVQHGPVQPGPPVQSGPPAQPGPQMPPGPVQQGQVRPAGETFPPDQRQGNGPYQGPPPGPGPHQPPGPVPPHAPGPQMPPGPYPPTVDPRAVQAHPGVQPAPGPNQQPPLMDPYQKTPWVSDGTPTAEEFARRRQAKPAEPTATMGARAVLRKTTMGLVKLAPGKHEQEYKQDVEMVRRNFGGLRQVTVVNPKGGAGKTVAVLLLAMTFGQKRGGYVLAWDNNETQGTLGMRAQQDFHARTVRDMMRDLHLFRGSHGRVGDLSQYVRAQGEGMFDVLASDESATAGEMLTASAFAEIREIVSRFYKLIMVDTGNNVRAQNWQAAMDATDQLVITMSARNDSAETAARMLDHLEQSGRQRLVRQAVSVVSMPPTRKDIDLPAIQRHFAARTRAVLLAPYEKLIDSGEPLRYGHLSSQTRDAWLKIAAAVAEGL